MKSIVEYLSDPQNHSFVLVLSVTLVVLIVLTAILVAAYSKKKRKIEENAEIGETLEEKAIPENLVDDEMLSEYNAEIEGHKEPSDGVKCETAQAEFSGNSSQPAESENGANTDSAASSSEKTPDAAAAEPTADGKNNETKAQTAEAVNEASNEVNAEPNDVAESAKAEQPSKRYAGKWVIVTEDDGRLYAYLKASNGEKMLATEGYSSLSGIKSGIDTLKKNIQKDNYAINLDKNGNFVFKIFSGANRLLCVGEGYSTRDQCEKAFASVKRFAATAVITVENKDE